ncbi:MAG: hypothetical protein AUK53_07265 [Betaproteobacteria bacterium CG2_30_59_46]|nr:MAG: hypothetical protein AUK53_07265 [Betaproteobacteria bacterium CG2_30_59_46]
MKRLHEIFLNRSSFKRRCFRLLHREFLYRYRLLLNVKPAKRDIVPQIGTSVFYVCLLSLLWERIEVRAFLW